MSMCSIVLCKSSDLEGFHSVMTGSFAKIRGRGGFFQGMKPKGDSSGGRRKNSRNFAARIEILASRPSAARGKFRNPSSCHPFDSGGFSRQRGPRKERLAG